MKISTVLALLALLASPSTAIQRCGNDVDGSGTAVPCACGDLVVSSRTLGPSDPVTAAPCPGNGLLVDADGSVVLDLGGRAIVGSNQGVGVLVVRGRLALVGPGTIAEFQTGVLARGAGELTGARDLRLVGNRLDGLSALGNGYAIEGVVAEGNGRDGFVLDGVGYAADGNRATQNGRHGFRLDGRGAHLGGGLGNEARENIGDGFVVTGRMHQLLDATATGNGADGIGGRAAQMLIDRARTNANLGSGIFAYGAGVTLRDSTANDNHGFGLWVDGLSGVDGGGNVGANNEGRTRYANNMAGAYGGWLAPLVQCRVGGGACR